MWTYLTCKTFKKQRCACYFFICNLGYGHYFFVVSFTFYRQNRLWCGCCLFALFIQNLRCTMHQGYHPCNTLLYLLFQINKGSVISVGMGIFRLFMTGKFDAYLLWSLGKVSKLISEGPMFIRNARVLHHIKIDGLMNWSLFLQRRTPSPYIVRILVPRKTQVTRKSC